MTEWELTEADLKKYPHFDPPIDAVNAKAYATDASKVSVHPFYPFIRYVQRWTRFAPKGLKGKSKERPIRYAARRDAYIYSYYRSLLSKPYEAELLRLGLAECILAYRQIKNASTGRGKCNIDFAKEAFEAINAYDSCAVLALDISSFFESLDHSKLKEIWRRLLAVPKLSSDHFKVFTAITKYSVVDKQKVYERLGHYGAKRFTKSGDIIKGYLTPFNKIPKQLCRGSEFRTKIAGPKSIIEKNKKNYGIPQGSPISDLLANIYLIDFDAAISEWAKEAGGVYFRYSDDILIILPGAEHEGRDFLAKVRTEIEKHGRKLKIKEEKSSLLVFSIHKGRRKCELKAGKQGKNGLEYLGFRYDGSKAYIRDSTLSGLRRKVVRAARRQANILARRYPDKNEAQLRKLFNYEQLIKKFGKVEDFYEKQSEYENWTFWTYTRRAAQQFGSMGAPILRQLRNHKRVTLLRADKEIATAVYRREKRKTA